MRKRISATTVISSVALFFSLGGGALAASRYLITSRSQIAPRVLQSLHGDRGARGATGLTGPTGPTGPQGVPGLPGQVTTVTVPAETPTLVSSANVTLTQDVSYAIVTCPAGHNVLTGGYEGDNEMVRAAFAKDINEYVVEATLTPGATSGHIIATAECS